MLNIERRSETVVAFAGRLDATQASAAQSALDGLGGLATLDCARLDYLSSAGLGVLLKTHKRLLAGGGRLRLVGVSRHLHDIFAFSGFDQLFEIERAP